MALPQSPEWLGQQEKERASTLMSNSTRARTPFDRAQAAEHLNVLHGGRPTRVALCYSPTPGARPSGEEPFWLPRQQDLLLNKARGLVDQGLDVYTTVLGLGEAGKRHRDHMAEMGHTVWFELDTGKAVGATHADRERAVAEAIEEVRAEGGYVVWSGGGAHCYFPLDEPLHKWDIERINRALVLRFAWAGADSACTDASRFLRLPGTNNHKAEYGEPRSVYIMVPFTGSLASSSELTASAPVSGPPAPLGGVLPEDVELEGFSDKLRALANKPDLEGNAGFNVSGAAFALVQQAKSEGMTPGQLLSATWHWNSRPSKYAGRWAKQIETIWAKPSTLTTEVVEAARAARPGRLKVTRASEIKVRPVHWLWDQHLALGTLGLLAGREGIGKSTIAYWIVAQVTQGTLPGRFEGTKRSVVIVATEDSWEHTIVPRLMAAGADLDLVLRVESTTEEGKYHSLSLPEDIEGLTELIEEEGVALVLLDPLMSRLGANIDSHKDAEVRKALEPLTHMADQAGAAIIGLIHLNKKTGSDLLSSVMASRAFTAVARSVMFAAVDPEDESKRYFGLGKNNLGRSDLPARTYEIENTWVADTDEGPVYTGAVKWTGESSETIADITSAYRPDAESREKAGDAALWLKEFLPTKESEALAKQAVLDAAGRAGYSESALDRAKKKIRFKSRQQGFGKEKTSLWWAEPEITQITIGSSQ